MPNRPGNEVGCNKIPAARSRPAFAMMTSRRSGWLDANAISEDSWVQICCQAGGTQFAITSTNDMLKARGDAMQPEHRRFPIGAEILPRGGVHFRVWAPKCKSVDVVLEGGAQGEAHALQTEESGYFAGTVDRARAGSL